MLKLFSNFIFDLRTIIPTHEMYANSFASHYIVFFFSMFAHVDFFSNFLHCTVQCLNYFFKC